MGRAGGHCIFWLEVSILVHNWNLYHVSPHKIDVFPEYSAHFVKKECGEVFSVKWGNGLARPLGHLRTEDRTEMRFQLLNWRKLRGSWDQLASSEKARGWGGLTKVSKAGQGVHPTSRPPHPTHPWRCLWLLDMWVSKAPPACLLMVLPFVTKAVCPFFPACGHGELLPLWVPED